MSKMTIGADPELFILDKDNRIASIEGLIGHHKDNPLVLANGVGLQEDNVMLELNIVPASTAKEFVDNVAIAVGTAKEFLEGYKLSPVPAALFPPALLASRQAKMSGCDPSLDAWGGHILEPVSFTALDRQGQNNYRFAGGHIHIGHEEIQLMGEKEKNRFVKTLDATIGLYGVLHDDDVIRHRFYGRAGNYRTQPHGIEYRVPSNYWLRSKEIQEDLFNLCSVAVDSWLAKEDEYFVKVLGSTYNRLPDVINYRDKRTAEHMLASLRLI